MFSYPNNNSCEHDQYGPKFKIDWGDLDSLLWMGFSNIQLIIETKNIGDQFDRIESRVKSDVQLNTAG